MLEYNMGIITIRFAVKDIFKRHQFETIKRWQGNFLQGDLFSTQPCQQNIKLLIQVVTGLLTNLTYCLSEFILVDGFEQIIYGAKADCFDRISIITSSKNN